MKRLEDFMRRLDRIAVANDDEFDYVLELELKKDSGMRFRFTVVEHAEKHLFLQGDGDTIEEAVQAAEEELDGVDAPWGYKVVE